MGFSVHRATDGNRLPFCDVHLLTSFGSIKLTTVILKLKQLGHVYFFSPLKMFKTFNIFSSERSFHLFCKTSEIFHTQPKLLTNYIPVLK